MIRFGGKYLASITKSLADKNSNMTKYDYCEEVFNKQQIIIDEKNEEIKRLKEKFEPFMNFIRGEYSPEEMAKNGNMVYGGSRHDAICDYLEESFKFTPEEMNNISMGIWLAIKAEKEFNHANIAEMLKDKTNENPNDFR